MTATRSVPSVLSLRRSEETSETSGASRERNRHESGSSANLTGARLCWWRTHSAEAFSKSDAKRIRVSLRACPKSGNSRWHHAIEGEVAAAVGIAIRVIWRRERFGISEDAAMTAVLACALDGDATAIFLLSAALDRRAKAHPECARLADSWLLASVASPPVAPCE